MVCIALHYLATAWFSFPCSSHAEISLSDHQALSLGKDGALVIPTAWHALPPSPCFSLACPLQISPYISPREPSLCLPSSSPCLFSF